MSKPANTRIPFDCEGGCLVWQARLQLFVRDAKAHVKQVDVEMLCSQSECALEVWIVAVMHMCNVADASNAGV